MLTRRHRNSGRQNDGKRFPSHLQWIRGFTCIAWKSGDCAGRMVAAHVDHAGGKGMSMKVSDAYTVPMCDHHHTEQHRIGWRSFEVRHGIDAIAEALKLARVSPSIQRAAREAGYQVEDAAE